MARFVNDKIVKPVQPTDRDNDGVESFKSLRKKATAQSPVSTKRLRYTAGDDPEARDD